MFNLLSDRIKNASGEPEVYVYDDLPAAFRTQVYYIIRDVIDPYCDYGNNFWNTVHDMFTREKGLKKLGHYEVGWQEYGEQNIEEYLDHSSTMDILDFIDYVFNIFDKVLRNVKPEYHSVKCELPVKRKKNTGADVFFDFDELDRMLKRMRMTRNEFCKKVGLCSSYFYNMEIRNSFPSYSKRKDICDYFRRFITRQKN